VTSRGGVTVQIGCENEEEELHSYSLVAAPFGHHGHSAGTVGVIGPTRMAYARTINVVSLVAACLGELLERFDR
jgi:heat-inducible transcriptional repressor